MAWFFLPFLMQGVAMFFDEFWFHHRRGLPLWERIGHPLDTLAVIACFAFVSLVPYAANRVGIYLALACFSTLLITKDEFVHARCCPPMEQWLHAFLFVLHPVVLGVAGYLWFARGIGVSPMGVLLNSQSAGPFDLLLVGQLGILILFALYQVVFWLLLP